MKKKLLLLTLLVIGGTASAQFTSQNAPVVGDYIDLYIVDSSASNLEAVSGDGVEWDYSGLSDYNNQKRRIDVKEVGSTDFNVTFNNSDIAFETEGELVTFVKNSASERVSQGVVYNDPEFGDLVLTLEKNQGLYYQYPFGLGDQIVDSVSGTATFKYLGQTVNSPAKGILYASLDGRGTLKLGGNTEYNNVLRYKLLDTIRLETILGEYSAIHTQYEYYDHTVSNLPIFTHSYLWFGPTNGTPRNEFTFVLTKNTATSSINEEALASTKLYPNPTNSIVNIELPSSINSAIVSICDAVGRVVLKSNLDNSISQLNVSHLKEGSYFVKIVSDNIVITKTLILQ